MIKIKAYQQLARSMICLIATLMALEGYWLATHQFSLSVQAVAAILAVGLTYGWSNALNDILDIQTDRVNYPQRPLPSGQLSMREASWFTGALFVLSLALSSIAGWRLFVLTIVLMIISLAYNLQLKKTPVLGKLIVAILTALTLSAGYFVVQDGVFPFIPVLVGFLFILAREFAGTISDAEGDKQGGRSSIALLLGKRFVLMICFILVVLSSLVLILPLFTFKLSSPVLYFVTILIFSLLPVYVAIFYVWRDQSPDTIRKVSFNMRYVMLSSLISLLWLV